MAEGEAGRALLGRAAADDRVRPLLLLHGLHPAGVEERTQEGLERVRPFLHSQGADVELVAVADDAVRLRLYRRDPGYPAPPDGLRAAVEEAVAVAAPDARLIEFVEVNAGGRGRLPLPVLPRVV